MNDAVAAKPRKPRAPRKTKAPAVDTFREEVGPTELYDPLIRSELKKAAVWIGMATLVVALVWLAQPILLIIGGLVLAAMFDGGARLLGRVLPIARGFRLTIVVLAVFGFMYWTFAFTGSELASQAASLQAIVEKQIETIGNQIAEVIRLHQNCDQKTARERTIEILRKVGLPKPEQTIDAYPFALSGGMRQRAMIAMALACQPSLLIADEPTTALDVTIQAQVLELMQQLQQELGMALIVITHDLAVISELCDRVLIMYLGLDVESAPADELFRNPKHPYTIGLLQSVPKLGAGKAQKIEAIEGTVPTPYDRSTGCPFHPRCPQFIPGTCDVALPPQVEVGREHKVRCHLYV